MRWVVGILMLVAGAVGLFFAVGIVLWQDDAVRHFVATDAVIVSSRVKVYHGKKSDSYTPEVEYRYRVGQQVLTSHQVFTVSVSSGRGWAEGIVRQFPTAARVTAYVNPRDPGEAILVRQYSSFPYWCGCVAAVVAAFGAAILLGLVGWSRTAMEAVLVDPAGWQLLLPAKSLRRRRRDALLVLVLTAAPCLLLVGHYLVRTLSVEAGGPVLAAMVGGLLVGQMVWVIRVWSVMRHVSDARLEVKPAPLKLGEPFEVRVELDAYAPLRVEGFTATVVCLEHYREQRGSKTYQGVRVYKDCVLELSGAREVAAGQMLSGEGQTVCDRESWPESSAMRKKKYPYYTWEVRVHAALSGLADYRAAFPIEAQ